jgi:hypothetical protein
LQYLSSEYSMLLKEVSESHQDLESLLMLLLSEQQHNTLEEFF